MSRPRTQEQRLLADAAALVARALTDLDAPADARLDLLEATAAGYAGWDLDDYRQRFSRPRHVAADDARIWGDKLLHLLHALPIPLPLALSALAHPQLGPGARRTAGAYYTDFRLAQHLAAQLPRTYSASDRVIDLAAGSGMLLVALTLHVGGGDRAAATRFVRDAVCGADLHSDALAATRAALAATVDDLDAVSALDARLVVGDSLTRPLAEWEALAPGGFAVAIGNPPWEKLKVTRHELLTSAGVDRHYGAAYTGHDDAAYNEARQRMLAYADELGGRARLQGKGEADLYKLFLELAARVVRPHGQLGLLLPAGLIRSQGTQPLREFLLDHAEALSLTVLENRASFFAIDTRFKFLAVVAQLTEAQPGSTLSLQHAIGTDSGVVAQPPVEIDRAELRRLRPDLTVPEVRTGDEWRIFAQMADHGVTLDDDRWRHSYLRELDMTNDKADFVCRASSTGLPLVEGRMVHQHRVRAKAYRSGTGRAAVWEPLRLAAAAVAPQFWYPRRLLTPALEARVGTVRAGFCDVTGQTNERTLLAALIPSGVVCGNKVPTLTFDVDGLSAEEAAALWVALVNSLPVDWAARRVVTTSMNYFLLRSLPLPRLGPDDAARVIGLASKLSRAEGLRGADLWELAQHRAQIDAIAARSLGLGLADFQSMLDDFRLLDRGQPPLLGETRSTVTRDVALSALATELGQDAGEWQVRADHARTQGAVPYVPADYAELTK
ncbi:Eco57I restriction-modification methylase domain-containing protein [Modestobacter sp. SYSU DS0657]